MRAPRGPASGDPAWKKRTNPGTCAPDCVFTMTLLIVMPAGESGSEKKMLIVLLEIVAGLTADGGGSLEPGVVETTNGGPAEGSVKHWEPLPVALHVTKQVTASVVLPCPFTVTTCGLLPARGTKMLYWRLPVRPAVVGLFGSDGGVGRKTTRRALPAGRLGSSVTAKVPSAGRVEVPLVVVMLIEPCASPELGRLAAVTAPPKVNVIVEFRKTGAEHWGGETGVPWMFCQRGPGIPDAVISRRVDDELELPPPPPP